MIEVSIKRTIKPTDAHKIVEALEILNLDYELKREEEESRDYDPNHGWYLVRKKVLNLYIKATKKE